MQLLKRNPLAWLMLLSVLWACLGVAHLEQKTASGQIYGPQTASWGVALWQAAPRLGFEGLAGESVSAPPVGANASGGVSLSSTEALALRTAGLTDAEIAQHMTLNGDIYLFRGTSTGWAGSPGAQATAVSASTDPYVATVFALEARAQGGQAVVQYGGKSQIGTFGEGNWMAAQEREVGVQMNAQQFAQVAPNNVSADVARKVLADMGFPPLPYSVATASDRAILLDAAPKMTPAQVAEFLRRVAGK